MRFEDEELRTIWNKFHNLKPKHMVTKLERRKMYYGAMAYAMRNRDLDRAFRMANKCLHTIQKIEEFHEPILDMWKDVDWGGSRGQKSSYQIGE